MAIHAQKPRLLTVEGLLGLLIAVIAAVGDMNWFLRSLLVLLGLGVIGHLAWRIPGKGKKAALLKVGVWAVLGAALVAVTWHPIWDDFHKKYPQVAFQSPISFIAPNPPPQSQPVSAHDPLAIMGYFGHPIAWMKLPIIGRSQTDPSKIDDLTFAGVNLKGQEVELKDAYVISGVDGTRQNLLVLLFSPFSEALPADIKPIPTHAPIYLTAQLNGSAGMSEADFHQRWATYSLIVEYKNDDSQRITFDQQSVADALTRVLPHPSAKH